MRVVSHPEADLELAQELRWYDRRERGLGLILLKSFERKVQEIASDPFRFRVIYRQDRKAKVARFPIAIIYTVESNTVYIKAVMHLMRRPGYWEDRR